MTTFGIKKLLGFKDDIFIIYNGKSRLLAYMNKIKSRLAVAYTLKLEGDAWSSLPMLDLRVGRCGFSMRVAAVDSSLT